MRRGGRTEDRSPMSPDSDATMFGNRCGQRTTKPRRGDETDDNDHVDDSGSNERQRYDVDDDGDDGKVDEDDDERLRRDPCLRHML
jgi:hypothetical protein